MPYGYNGKVLRVDLSRGSIDVEALSEQIYRTYLGGSALALYYLLRELKPGTDPLGPDNLLIFASNVVSGAPVAGLTRYSVAARSPLTCAFGEAEAGGFWGPELKMAGFDAIIIKGKAHRPSYLWVKDGEAEIRDAADIWGLETGPAQERIRQQLGDQRIRVAQTGPAGERLVRYACILNELKHANGRTGMGAVMGSKNLRAVAVRGTSRLTAADPEALKEIGSFMVQAIKDNPGDQALRKMGTANLVMPLNESGILPTRNFKSGYFEGAENISGAAMTDEILERAEGCYACAVQCKRAVKVEDEELPVSPRYGGPEYETLGSLGSLLCIDDLKAIAHGNELCNRYGMDTISVGTTIAFTMECFENGLISPDEADGLEIRFGSTKAMVELIHKIARREGIGDLLAEGVLRAAQKIGRGSEKYAMHIKGQELPMHEPRVKTGMGLGFAVSPTGADHIEAPHDTPFQQHTGPMAAIAPMGLLEPMDQKYMGPEKVRQFVYLQQIWSLYNCVGMCNFAAGPNWAMPLKKLVQTVEAVTGWESSLWELLKVGERAVTMARVFNTREGFGRKDDTWPDRLFEPLEGGPTDGQTVERKIFDDALSLYYGMMGWDTETGTPARSKLWELNLGWLPEADK
ncbi:MAG: aldehyde ferredoxin oxidoreductase family protein [Deltaproteobacteria bacterium]|nr:aldehyde ferredoxin oxidoreductase family protein [Deltaproteobacteria bacterium]